MSAWTITKKKPEKLAVSLANSYNTARFWQNQRLTTDNFQFAKYLAGDVSYDDLSLYFKGRMRGAGFTELQNIEDLALKAKEKKESIDDETEWNKFAGGLSSFDEYNNYVDGRISSVEENTPEYASLLDLQNAGVEKNRLNEEFDVYNRYQAGQIGFNEYRNFLNDRSALYDPGSERAVGIQNVITSMEPQYKVNQLNNLYRSNFWGDDIEDNLVGYEGSIKELMGTYGVGSPERMEIENLFAEVSNTVKLVRQREAVNSSASNLNQSISTYNSLVRQYERDLTNFKNGIIDQTQIDNSFNALTKAGEQLTEAEKFYNDISAKAPAEFTSGFTFQKPELVAPEIQNVIQPSIPAQPAQTPQAPAQQTAQQIQQQTTPAQTPQPTTREVPSDKIIQEEKGKTLNQLAIEFGFGSAIKAREQGITFKPF